jgi:hypothetical protein
MHYIRRTLTYINERSELQQISDLDLTAFVEPMVILGEPGMGKTYLLRQLSQRPGWTFRSAASFVSHPDPAALALPGTRLVIDGLDELSAAQESDPVYRVLHQLIAAGRPPFILSCRAADWRGAVGRQDISDEYGVSPRQLSLEPLSREAAIELLKSMVSAVRAAEIIDYLEEKGIPDLYGNPLTLALFGEIAAKSSDLPQTRAELLRRASEVMWREHNDRHDASALSTLDQETALTAAGVASAAIIVTGSGAITLKPSGIATPQAIHAADLLSLRGGEHVRTLVGSRLFTAIPGADDQFRPIHRAVAEFLGATWLARSATDDQARGRVLAMMTIDSGVPASLRGIHAWLARDHRFATKVIVADPYGLLRYGDADGLTVDQGRQLLRALKELQQTNPYFRAEDWRRQSAKGLTHIELLEDIRAVLLAKDTSFHLRTLLLEVIRGSELARNLIPELQGLLMNQGEVSFEFRERHEAAKAILAIEQTNVDWRQLVERLIQIADQDSTRLALELMDDLKFKDFNPDDIARAVLAYLGLLDDANAAERDRCAVGPLYMTARRIPHIAIAPVLDALAAHFPIRDPDCEYLDRFELTEFVAHMIERQIEREPPEPLLLLKWLRIVPGLSDYSGEDRQSIGAFIQQSHEVRRAIQAHFLFVERAPREAWQRIWHPAKIHNALALSADDVIHHLTQLASKSNPSVEDSEIWRELATFGRRTDGRAEDIIQAARAFALGKAELETHLDDLQKPRPQTEWEIEQAARREERERDKMQARAKHRKDFTDNEMSLRAGEFAWIYPVSMAYLSLYADMDRTLAPPDRIGQWLGPELQTASLIGFEAALTRSDIPSLRQIAIGYAESRRWNFVYPMIAGIVQRLRNGRSLDDVSSDIVMSVQIALHNEHLGERIDADNVIAQLDAVLRRDSETYERYVRYLIEPSIERGRTHIAGLYSFARSAVDQELACRLSKEWLMRHRDLPTGLESELIDIMAASADLDAIRDLYRERVAFGFKDDEHRRSWQSAGLLADFETAAASLGVLPASEQSFLWCLRERMGGDRDRSVSKVPPSLLAWIVSQFRQLWPNEERPVGVTSGDTNPWDASEFLRASINRLATDLSDMAVAELTRLVDEPGDGYTLLIRYAADQQRRARRETSFQGVTLDRLKDAIQARPPRTTDDLLAIILYALGRLQAELRGSDTDTVAKYWGDTGEPRNEDSCTDRLIEDVERLLPPYGIGRIPQRDMPKGKRADIVFTIGEAALPVECKGQWHPNLWSAAEDQLDAFYLRDWRSQERGLYIVYWFGFDVSSAKQIKRPPERGAQPTTAAELHRQLLARIPPARRGSIAIEVLDLTR